MKTFSGSLNHLSFLAEMYVDFIFHVDLFFDSIQIKLCPATGSPSELWLFTRASTVNGYEHDEQWELLQRIGRFLGQIRGWGFFALWSRWQICILWLSWSFSLLLCTKNSLMSLYILYPWSYKLIKNLLFVIWFTEISILTCSRHLPPRRHYGAARYLSCFLCHHHSYPCRKRLLESQWYALHARVGSIIDCKSFVWLGLAATEHT